MSTSVVIREIGPKDAGLVAMLFTEFNSILGADGLAGDQAYAATNVQVSAGQMERRLKAIAPVEQTLIAESDGEPAGLACLRLVPYIGQDDPYAEVTQLYVRKHYQRQRIGAALIEASERLATRAGATCVHIITGSDNAGAQAFYRSVGYQSFCLEFTKYFEGAFAKEEPVNV